MLLRENYNDFRFQIHLKKLNPFKLLDDTMSE